MNGQRSETAKYRNIRLSMETYNLLEKYLLSLIQEREDTKVPFDDAVKSLLDEHYSKEM